MHFVILLFGGAIFGCFIFVKMFLVISEIVLSEMVYSQRESNLRWEWKLSQWLACTERGRAKAEEAHQRYERYLAMESTGERDKRLRNQRLSRRIIAGTFIFWLVTMAYLLIDKHYL